MSRIILMYHRVSDYLDVLGAYSPCRSLLGNPEHSIPMIKALMIDCCQFLFNWVYGEFPGLFESLDSLLVFCSRFVMGG